MRICLNMIVKNEVANLPRCLASVVDHIDCYCIADTGSTDGTPALIESFFFAKRRIEGGIVHIPFVDFSQARNAALNSALDPVNCLDFDYLLLVDADMELVVEGELPELNAPSYMLLQRQGDLAYWNTRLVQCDAPAIYHGVTHEYLEVPGRQPLEGWWFKDHASGANRADKFERDIALLKGAVAADPSDGRSWFYLGQSYRDLGQFDDAAACYRTRARMGGWEEEAWNARLQLARCELKRGDEAVFIQEALAAFNQRPARAEPLYDLAKFYRERGQNELGIMFAQRGLRVPYPQDDLLFIEPYPYQVGLAEELSICANYSADRQTYAAGYAACEALALDRGAPAAARDLARSNLKFYLPAAAQLLPSFESRPVGFTPPDSYAPMNPSVCRLGDRIMLMQRAVNYRITPEGRYWFPGDEQIRTRNFLIELTSDLDVAATTEIRAPTDWPMLYHEVQGIEDARLFAWNDKLWVIGCVRQLNHDGWCEQVVGLVDDRAGRFADCEVIHHRGERRHEKNWMPHNGAHFVYRCDPTEIISVRGDSVVTGEPAFAADNFSGGSQLVPFGDGSLALVHEAIGQMPNRHYRHRFVFFDGGLQLRRTSSAFYFHKKGIEFVAGLAWHPEDARLIISYGVDDRESWIATVHFDDVQRALGMSG